MSAVGPLCAGLRGTGRVDASVGQNELAPDTATRLIVCRSNLRARAQESHSARNEKNKTKENVPSGEVALTQAGCKTSTMSLDRRMRTLSYRSPSWAVCTRATPASRLRERAQTQRNIVSVAILAQGFGVARGEHPSRLCCGLRPSFERASAVISLGASRGSPYARGWFERFACCVHMLVRPRPHCAAG